MNVRLQRAAVLVVMAGAVGAAGMSRGAAIVDYNFVSNPVPTVQPTSVGPTTVAANVTSSSINSGVGTSSGAGASNGGGTNGNGLLIDYITTGYSGEFLRAATNATAGTQTTEAQSVATAGYFNLVVTPQNGAKINFTDISITGARGGASTPRGFFLESSIDNPNNTWGTKDIFGIGSEQSQRPSLTTYNASNYQSYETGGTNATSLGTGSLDLSTNPAYQNVTTPIEFRFYVIAPGNGNSIDFTDFSLNGTVTAPEPASLGLFGLGMLGLLGRRRRPTA